MKSCGPLGNFESHMYPEALTIISLLLLSCNVLVVFGDTQSAASCRQAQDDCQISHTCGLHYHSVLIRCRDTSSNDTACTEECQIAQHTLASGTREGTRFTQCACTGVSAEDIQYCRNLHKVFSCVRSTKADQSLKPSNTTVSCNDARRYCEEDWVCRDALHYYEVACEQSTRRNRGRDNTCPTVRCQDSFEILIRQTQAENLRGCTCDDVTAAPRWVYCFDFLKFADCEAATIMQTFVSASSKTCHKLSILLVFVFSCLAALTLFSFS
ncbi:hypothetical protein RvY_14823 [Ramazzottius varieornatus]|uniref:GDNF/GAS1 domain-containing protein n=1 Tax=Ramazzottius varieornatus TaxID=947166 RepID=A0A1D1VUE8_RAMVA|nr:hypothetical protein RvY_14823 [Ramazzottius varieornatus]